MGILLLTLGVACIAYGVSVFLVFSGTLFFAVWLAIGVALVAWSRLVLSGMWDRLPALVRTGVPGIALAGLAFLLALGAAIMHDVNQKPPAGLDYLVVLGAQIKQDGPSVVLRYRLDAAYDYLV